MEQILRIKQDLETASSKKDSKKALELLQSLVNIPITMIVLQDTHIGLVVNKVRRQFDDPEIVSIGRSVMRKWKKMYEESKNGTSSDQVPAPAEPVTSTTTNTSSTSQTKAPIQTEVPHTTSSVRLKFREMMVEALKTPLPRELQNQEPFLDEEVLAARIEDHIYLEFRSESDMKYKSRVRSRIMNFKDPKNPYLRLNVLRGDIAPERMAKMTADEMASDELKREREKYTKEAINDHQMALTTGTKTSEIKCPACKKYDCTYNQMQTRSSDEPMTTFCYCNNCGKRWKFC